MRRGAAWTLGGALCVALADAGFSLRAEPGGPVVAQRGRSRLKPFDAVEAMTRGETDPASWRRRCEAEGLSTIALSGLPATPPSPEPALPAAPAG